MTIDLSKKETSVLLQVYYARSISRAQLSKNSTLKSASLYRSVDSLLKCGYLVSKENIGLTPSSPGRPSDLLELNPEVGYALSLSIWRRTCHIALMDFSGRSLCEDDFAFDGVPTATVFYSRLKHLIHRLQNSISAHLHLLGISIAIVGLLDKEGQKIVKLTHNPYPFVQDLILPKILFEEYNVPVIIHNITTCAAVGYHVLHPDTQNMSYIFVDDGIANHTIIHGESLPIKKSTLNGFGHMSVSLDGKKCECGAYGCLETYCSAYSISKEIRSMIKYGMESQLRSTVDSFSFRDVCTALQNGDPLCRDVVSQAAAVFCIGLNNYVQLLPVDTLVFSGSVINEATLFFEYVQKTMAQRPWEGSMYRDSNMQGSVTLGCHTLLLQQLLSAEPTSIRYPHEAALLKA